MAISAIQTEYNGYKFRSRLEARWAVFFDSLEIEYQYEPEGFKMSGGVNYLPDFYLPHLDTYVEVKPFDESRFAELKKCASFVLSDSSKKLVILGNIPNLECPVIWYPCLYKDAFCDTVAYIRPVCLGASPDELFGYHAVARSMDIIAKPYFAKESLWYSHEGRISDPDMPYPENRDFRDLEWAESFSDDDLNFLSCAYKNARQARFEFGETPSAR